MISKYERLDIPIINSNVDIWYCEDYGILEKDMCVHYNLNSKILNLMPYSHVLMDGDNIVCVLRTNSKNTIVHECVHIAWYLLHTIHVNIDVNNHEIQAYLVDYLYEKIVEFVFNKK